MFFTCRLFFLIIGILYELHQAEQKIHDCSRKKEGDNRVQNLIFDRINDIHGKVVKDARILEAK